MLQTVRCFRLGHRLSDSEDSERELLWEEEVTYDDRYWEYISGKYSGIVRYKHDGYFKVPEKPKGMTHCYRTFEGYQGYKLDLSFFDTSDVVDMCELFNECVYLQSIDLSSFDTSNVTNMNDMFAFCSKLQSLDLSHFDTAEVTTMSHMFYKCSGLQSLDISSFDTSNVTSMLNMFNGCTMLRSLDLSHFNTASAGIFGTSMFEGTRLSQYTTGLGKFNKKPKKPIRKQIKKFKGNDSLDDISKEIDKLLEKDMLFYGSSPKVLIDSLRDSGFLNAGIVGSIMYKINSGFLDRDIYMPIVNSYIEKRIQPEIVKNLSSKSIGEVLDILYSRYPENLVNKAMCTYLRPQYLVD